MKSVFSTDFSIVSSPNRVLTPLQSASFEIRISSFVPPSKIFVWDGYICEFDRHIGMLPSCAFERHIGMQSS
jgi:hypothetical protein